MLQKRSIGKMGVEDQRFSLEPKNYKNQGGYNLVTRIEMVFLE